MAFPGFSSYRDCQTSPSIDLVSNRDSAPSSILYFYQDRSVPLLFPLSLVQSEKLSSRRCNPHSPTTPIQQSNSSFYVASWNFSANLNHYGASSFTPTRLFSLLNPPLRWNKKFNVLFMTIAASGELILEFLWSEMPRDLGKEEDGYEIKGLDVSTPSGSYIEECGSEEMLNILSRYWETIIK